MAANKTKKTNERVNNVLNNIKIIRAIKGYSQEFVAKKLDLDYSTYGKMENGSSSITIERLFNLCDIYEVPVTKLMFGYEENSTSVDTRSKDPKELKLYVELSLSEVELLKEIISKRK